MQVQRLARALLATATAVGAVAATAVSASAAPATNNFTVAVTGTSPFLLGADTPVNTFIDKDGTFHAQTSISGYSSQDEHAWWFLAGTNLDNAYMDQALTTANGDTTARCNNSPTGLEATYGSYPDRNYCDLNGVWVDPDTGNWYGLVHNEFTKSPFGDYQHYDSIDFAESTDQGKTWTIKAHVITSPYSTVRGDTAAFPQQTYDYGDGDPRLYVDTASGYFYVYYGSRIVDKGGNWQAFYAHVARAPIASKMASGSWRKWYDGSWSQPGVGGKESNMVPVSADNPNGYTPADNEYNPDTPGTTAQQVAAGQAPPTSPLFVMDITYDAYLGLYIGEPQNPDQSGNAPQEFYATRSLATQKWFKLGDTGSHTDASWYRWFADGANAWNSAFVGKDLRSYCINACWGPYNYGNYTNITIGTDSPAAPVSPGGSYQIANGGGRELAEVGNGTASVAATAGHTRQATWTFTPDGDGSYTITNAATGKVLGVDDSSTAGRAWGAQPVMASKSASGPSVGQQWWVVPDTSPATGAATGAFHLVNRYSGLDLALSAVAARSAETTPGRSWTDPSSTDVGAGRTAAEQTLTLRPAGS